MTAGQPSSQRRAAALLAALAVPAGLGIVLAGGGIALAPLLLLLVPILVLGRAPGIETLERVRTRLQARRPRPCSDPAPGAGAPPASRLRPALLIAGSLAERGPPLIAPNS